MLKPQTLNLKPYFRLMRLHQPTGIWLLLWPCWWSIALASQGFPSLRVLLLFAAGAVLMRGAGCIINDIADRELDKQVERTRNRPLASGELSVKQASLFLALLLFISLLIALELGAIVAMWAMLSLIPVAIYPFMKRISWWPQLFLGLTFNWGALMGWAAVRGTVESPAMALYIGGIFWTLGYDTIYAHQDKIDDIRAGIKSTALRFGKQSKPMLALFYFCAILCWITAGIFSRSSFWYFAIVIITALQFVWQIRYVDLDNPASCRRVFISNARLGWLVFFGCIIASF